MKWKWLSAFLALLIILLAGIYHILDPENSELNETVRARLGGTYIRLSDGITHYKLEGPDDGKVVVLVHGGTVPIWTWDKQVQALNDAFGDYSNTYQIVGNQKRDILLVWGTADTEITKEMIRDIQSSIPHLKFKPVEGVGHGMVFQKSDTVNNMIISFL